MKFKIKKKAWKKFFIPLLSLLSGRNITLIIDRPVRKVGIKNLSNHRFRKIFFVFVTNKLAAKNHTKYDKWTPETQLR